MFYLKVDLPFYVKIKNIKVKYGFVCSNSRL